MNGRSQYEVSKNEIMWARQYGRAMAGRRAALKDVFVRGDRYSLVAAITTEGYMAAHAVEGSFDSESLYEFIATKVRDLYLCSITAAYTTMKSSMISSMTQVVSSYTFHHTLLI
ncbi:hypothetical protein BDR07DRAFT_1383396 [Suillus spraguei]|nr:hypothetical protein BDR07DRAFT_1383396 [Suillus spraguei]